jgi:hypothetical protein
MLPWVARAVPAAAWSPWSPASIRCGRHRLLRRQRRRLATITALHPRPDLKRQILQTFTGGTAANEAAHGELVAEPLGIEDATEIVGLMDLVLQRAGAVS